MNSPELPNVLTDPDELREPWEGDAEVLYPSDDVRLQMRDIIRGELSRAAFSGIDLEELADSVARRGYEEGGEVVFNTGDATLEISRMMGSSICIGSQRRLFPKK